MWFYRFGGLSPSFVMCGFVPPSHDVLLVNVSKFFHKLEFGQQTKQQVSNEITNPVCLLNMTEIQILCGFFCGFA